MGHDREVVVDLVVGAALGPGFEDSSDQRSSGRVWDEPSGQTRAPVAVGPYLGELLFISDRGQAVGISMADLDRAPEAGLDRLAQILAVLGGLIGQETLEQAPFERVGDIVDDGMDGEATTAQVGDVIQSIIILAGQAGELSENGVII
jgi:hypothetical protein